jgi:hypothetical protein
MKLVYSAETYYLEEKGERVKLTSKELDFFRKIAPLG